MNVRTPWLASAQRFALALSLFMLPVTAHAQSYTLVNSVRLPAESFVGDEVELRYTIRTTEHLEASDDITDPAWGDIESVRVIPRDDEYDVRILLVPFEPGTLTLPRIDLGGVSLDGLSVVVSSVLKEGDQLRPIYGPQRLPGTRLAMLIVVLGVAIPLLILVYLAGPGRVLVRRAVDRYRARVPYRNLMQTIDRLESAIATQASREFYTELVSSIQDLMTSRLEFECRSATSTELRSYLPALAASCRARAELAEPLGELFAAADDAKFAELEIRRKTRGRHLEACRAAVTQLELLRRKGAPHSTKRSNATRGHDVGV